MSRFTAILTIILFLTISCISIEWAARLPDSTPGTIAGTSTSVSALVEPNPINTWNSKLTEREQSLDAREKELNAKEAYLNKQFAQNPLAIKVLYILFTILLTLVLLNFYLDHRREHSHFAR